MRSLVSSAITWSPAAFLLRRQERQKRLFISLAAQVWLPERGRGIQEPQRIGVVLLGDRGVERLAESLDGLRLQCVQRFGRDRRRCPAQGIDFRYSLQEGSEATRSRIPFRRASGGARGASM